MRKNKKNIQKAKAFLAALGMAALGASAAFPQEADDGFVVPLDEDFSTAVVSAPAAATGGASSVKQGLWVEVTSSNKAIVRDIASCEKKGYEFDNSHFLSEANWWFWGDITPTFHLDAEISAWNFDKTLYQANSYADNDPTMSWKDGFEQLAAMPFSFIYNGNDDDVGTFNKMGFSIINPYFQVKFGYGKLKANGMLDFDGIYYVIDRWDSVDKGFTELSLGKSLQKFGDLTVNATAALSMMRGTYGLYDLLDVKYGDETSPLAELALTFGSKTDSEHLYDYGDADLDAASGYLALQPVAPLKIEFHALGTFGNDITFGKEYLALAGRAGWQAERWGARLMESYAGVNVNSVWGSDGQSYDDINAGKSFTQLDAFVAPLKWLTIGLDEGLSLPSYDEDTVTLSYASDTTADYSLRNQPSLDLDMSSLLGTELTLGAYGVVYYDKVISGKKSKTIATLQELGTEITWSPDLELLRKVKFDYAQSTSFDKWTSSAGSSLKRNVTYHSVILTAEMTENFNVFGGMIYRDWETSSDANQPVGFSLGYAVNRTFLPGHPKLWMHFTYGMDPFEDNNYSLYRADDPLNKPIHRTYLLNDFEKNLVNSFIRVGLIWDL